MILIAPPSGGGTVISGSIPGGGVITIPLAGASPDPAPSPARGGSGARGTGGGFSSIFSGMVVLGSGSGGVAAGPCAPEPCAEAMLAELIHPTQSNAATLTQRNNRNG